MTIEPVSFRKERGHAPRLSKPYVPGKHSRVYWTEAEQQVLRDHYEKGGAAPCALRLDRPLTTIYQQAHKLGLHYSGSGGGPKTKHPLPPDLEARLPDLWAELKGRGAVTDLARELGMPRWRLSKIATKLGLTLPHRKEPPWTAAEDELMTKVPLHSPDLAARVFRQHGFHRTPTAIVVRAKRLSLSRRATRDTLSAREAAKILGVDNKNLTLWCISGELKAGRRGSARLPQQGGDAWAIEPAELRRFVLENLARIDFRKVDKFALVDLLIGGAADG